MRRRKAYQNICGILSFLGFLLLMGSVGAMELDNISTTQGMLQSIISLAIFAGAARIGGFME